MMNFYVISATLEPRAANFRIQGENHLGTEIHSNIVPFQNVTSPMLAILGCLDLYQIQLSEVLNPKLTHLCFPYHVTLLSHCKGIHYTVMANTDALFLCSLFF